jgi:DNA-binding transcriptional regulator YdaS (Cro superfamily)
MSSFRDYFNTLTPDQRKDLAAKVDTTVGYLKQIAWAKKKPGAVMCNKLEQATGGEVTRELLRPDIFSQADAEAA